MFVSIIEHLKPYGRAITLRHKPKSAQNRDRNFGFMHIGKNAGSTVGDFLLELTRMGYKPPMVLGHDWNLESVAIRYPGMKISFLLSQTMFSQNKLSNIISSNQ